MRRPMTLTGPFTATFNKWGKKLVRASLEESLHGLLAYMPSPWRIEDAAGRVVASSVSGILSEFCPSLLARQLLSKLPLAGDAHTTIGEIDICTDAYSSTDDGKTWTKLLDTPDRPAKTNGVPRSRAKGLTVPVTFDWMARSSPSPAADLAVDIVIRHAHGRLQIDGRFLELRPSSKPERWDLVILRTLPDGTPSKISKGVYVSNLSASEAQAAANLGIHIQSPRDPNAPTKTWKPGLVSTLTHEGTRQGRPGWVRGHFGIDRRSMEIKGHGGHKYHELRFCLTHLPTGCMILHCKHKTGVEWVADVLREEVPELAELETRESVNESVGERCKEIIERLESEDRRRLA